MTSDLTQAESPASICRYLYPSAVKGFWSAWSLLNVEWITMFCKRGLHQGIGYCLWSTFLPQRLGSLYAGQVMGENPLASVVFEIRCTILNTLNVCLVVHQHRLPISFIGYGHAFIYHHSIIHFANQTLFNYKVHPRGLGCLESIFSSAAGARSELNEPCTHRARTDRFVSAAFEVVMTTCLLFQSKAGLGSSITPSWQ